MPGNPPLDPDNVDKLYKGYERAEEKEEKPKKKKKGLSDFLKRSMWDERVKRMKEKAEESKEE